MVPPPSPPSPKPNFLVIFTDDQTFRAIGYNNPEVRTPTLDRLARQGVIFSHAYTASPICVASRASVLTGRFPQQHGIVGLDTPSFLPRVEQGKLKTLPSYLAEAGYVTALCGKSHLGEHAQAHASDRHTLRRRAIFHDQPQPEFAVPLRSVSIEWAATVVPIQVLIRATVCRVRWRGSGKSVCIDFVSRCASIRHSSVSLSHGRTLPAPCGICFSQ